MTTDVAVYEPSSLVQVEDTCQSIEQWAEQCESVPELRDANNKLAAIDQYLARTSREGRARVSAAQRRLEVRIGHLLGPAEPTAGPGRGKPSVTNDGLSRDERHEFRRMAANEDTVEQVIEQSDDDRPASRRQVAAAINGKPQRTPLPDVATKAGWDLRKAIERIERIANDDRLPANKEQVAANLRGHLTHTAEVCQDLLDRLT